jgi:hypothetical protein
MANIKTEMNGTGGGRWTTREDAKNTSKGARRRNGRGEIAEQLADMEEGE